MKKKLLILLVFLLTLTFVYYNTNIGLKYRSCRILKLIENNEYEKAYSHIENIYSKDEDWKEYEIGNFKMVNRLLNNNSKYSKPSKYRVKDFRKNVWMVRCVETDVYDKKSNDKYIIQVTFIWRFCYYALTGCTIEKEFNKTDKLLPVPDLIDLDTF